jgi:hypothetical protein
MKLSFIAYQKKLTLPELLMKSILNSYLARHFQGEVKNPYPDPKASKTIYGIIMGETDFKQYAVENLSKMKGMLKKEND